MMLKLKTFAFAIMATGAALISGCQAEETIPVGPDALVEMNADGMTTGLEHYFTQDGIRQARLLADTAFTYQDSDSMSLRGIEMTNYSDAGEVRATVTADRGITEGNSMVARQNVVLIIPEDDRRIESAELHYDPDGDRIWSDSATVMYEGSSVIRGSAFQSDLQFQNVTVQEATTVTGGGP